MFYISNNKKSFLTRFSSRERWGSLALFAIAFTGFLLPNFFKAQSEKKLPVSAKLQTDSTSAADTDLEPLEATHFSHLHLKFAKIEDLVNRGISQEIATKIVQRYLNKKRYASAEEMAEETGLTGEFIQANFSPKSFLNFYKKQKVSEEEIAKQEAIEFDKPKSKIIAIVEINSCDSAALEALPGIGAKSARRIILYRNKLGGFLNLNQIKETYGIDTSKWNVWSAKLSINTFVVRKINLQSCTENQLVAHPYCKKYQAKAMLAFRGQHGTLTLADCEKLGVFKSVEWKAFKNYLAE